VQAAEASFGHTSLLLVVPTAFMNVSGPPIASFARKRGVPVDRVIACHDDIDLAFGSLRVKQGGSTAGHHGLDSMVQAFRSSDFYRVRLGVGRPPGRQDPADFVLQPFTARERDDVSLMLSDAADAVLALASDGLDVTQARYNRGGVRESGGA
jgi:peptidyl-tRNA hydrolase, PTH1 family